ncbi:MAG: hypothetical protein ACLVJ6_07510 [Merdibacter sp.]
MINDGKPRWVMEQMEKQLKGDQRKRSASWAWHISRTSMICGKPVFASCASAAGKGYVGMVVSRIPPRIRWGIPLLSLDECLDVCDHVVIALGHREFRARRRADPQRPHYDCIGFEQGKTVMR